MHFFLFHFMFPEVHLSFLYVLVFFPLNIIKICNFFTLNLASELNALLQGVTDFNGSAHC